MMRMWIELVLIVSLSILATLGLVFLLRRDHRRTHIQGTTDVEGAYVTTIATLYAILMAFMIFVVWTQYYDAQNTVEREATALGDIYRLSRGMPEPDRSQTQKFCLDYAKYMISNEWPEMMQGKNVSRPSVLLEQMWTKFTHAESTSAKDPVLRDHLMAAFVELGHQRRTRLLQARVGLPNILWVVLIFGALVTVGLAAIFETEEIWPHALKAGALAALVSLTLYTIWALDSPFDGLVTVPPSAFQRTIEIIQVEQKMQATPPVHSGHPSRQHAFG